MGMFDPNQPFDASSFNYTTASDKVKRQRELAASMMATKQPVGQMVPGGPNGFYAAPSKFAHVAAALQQVLGGYLSGKADEDQAAVDKNSMDAFKSQFGALDGRIRDPKQDGVEAAAQSQREANRFSSGVDAGQQVEQPEAAQSFGVPDSQITTTDLPKDTPVQTITPTVKAGAAKQLVSGGGGKFEGHGASGSWDEPAKPSAGAQFNAYAQNKPVGSIFDKASPLSVSGGAPIAPPTAVAPTATAPMPVAPPTAAMPALTAPQAPPQAPAPLPSDPGMTQGTNGQGVANPFSASPSAPGTSILADGKPFQTSNPDPYARDPSQDEMVQRLVALGRTGPEGQTIAQAKLSQLFASKNGRFNTTVHADTVNGGFVQVTTDTQTGQSQVKPIGTTGGQSPTQQRLQLDTVKAQGEQRRVLNDSGAAVSASGQAISNLTDALGFAQKLGNTGILSSTWNSLKNKVKDNPDYSSLNYLTSDAILDDVAKMKGGLSDKDMGFLRDKRPGANSTVQEWMAYANQAMPILQAAQARTNERHAFELQTAKDLGIRGLTPSAAATPSAAGGTRLDWKR